MPRLFFALWPDDEERDQLSRSAQILAAETDGRAVPSENLHLTLAFAGEVDESRVVTLANCAERLFKRPIEMRIDQAGCFDKTASAWMAMSEPPESLFKLQAALQLRVQAAGFEFDTRTFRPHITVVRKYKIPFVMRAIEPIHWRARTLCLVNSTPTQAGMLYSLLKHWRV